MFTVAKLTSIISTVYCTLCQSSNICMVNLIQLSYDQDKKTVFNYPRSKKIKMRLNKSFQDFYKLRKYKQQKIYHF